MNRLRAEKSKFIAFFLAVFFLPVNGNEFPTQTASHCTVYVGKLYCDNELDDAEKNEENNMAIENMKSKWFMFDEKFIFFSSEIDFSLSTTYNV